MAQEQKEQWSRVLRLEKEYYKAEQRYERVLEGSDTGSKSIRKAMEYLITEADRKATAAYRAWDNARKTFLI